MNKKLKARMDMLKLLSKDKSSELHSGLGEKLKGKKLSKVEVIASDKEGLKKGLSKAQQILKAKLGEEVLGEEDSEDESVEEPCEHCEGSGCKHCEGEEEDSEEE